MQPNIIEQIAEVVVEKFNSEISESAVLVKLKQALKDKEKAINSILDALEKGICTKSTQERLLKLENEKDGLEEKIIYEENHQLKPLEKSQIVDFLKLYARKKFDSKTDKNDFFNNFILRVNLFDDRITIVYNTSFNPAEEIYKRTPNNPDDDPKQWRNNDFIRKNLKCLKNGIKKLPFDNSFKRQLSGGANVT